MSEESSLRWVVREVPLLGAVNSCAILLPIALRLASFHLSPAWAIACAVGVFGVLTALNLASARYHASSGRRVYWPLFAVFELIAAAAGILWLL
jgi:hypothetical protein